MERARENVTGLLVFVILGAGFVALFAGASWFWLVWVLGFAVLLPIVGILTGEADDHVDDLDRATDQLGRRAPTGSASPDRPDHAHETGDDRDALETLRDRYARGELSDEQFERKLEALLETETFEGARDRLTRRERERVDDETAGDGARPGDGDRGRREERERSRERELERDRE
jgi:uncharacterized membrane protein